MKCMVIAAILVASIPICSAQEFFLADPSGRRTGPFQFEHGGKLNVGTTNYTIVIPSVERDQNAVVQKMKKIIIPEIDFRQANINDVVAFLTEASSKFDTGPEPKGIRPLLGLSVDPAPRQATPEESAPIPLITFSARNISLYEAVSVVCRVAGLRWEVVGSAITFLPKGRQAGQQGAALLPRATQNGSAEDAR